MASKAISINRAPVLTLWAAVVAERLGFDKDEGLSLGKALAGLTAQTMAAGWGSTSHMRNVQRRNGRKSAARNSASNFAVGPCLRRTPRMASEP